MAEHTPGPWQYLPSGEIVAHDGAVVAEPCSDHDAERDACEACANGQLMATSPDLLEAAEALIEAFLPTPKTASEAAAYDALQAQCRRARGETP